MHGRSRRRLPQLGPITKTNPIGGYNLRPRDSLIPFKNNNPSPDNAVVSPPSTTTTTLTSDDLRKLIHPLTHSQLTEIVTTASLNHPDVLDAVRVLADTDLTQRKLRVRGLDLETTSASLRSVFAPYGELKQAIVIKDVETRKSTCYGLVIYKHVDSALLALKEPCKVIDGRITVCGLAKDSSSVFFADNVNAGRNVDGAKACLVDSVKCVDGRELIYRLSNGEKVKPGDIAALVTADTQGDVAKPKVLIRGTFGSCGVTASGGNSCGLVGPGGIQGYCGGGQGMSLSAQVQGSGDGVRLEVVKSNQQSSMQGSFASLFGSGGPSVDSSNGDGSFGYGVLGKGPPLGDSQHLLNLSSGGGSVMASFGSSVGGMGLSTSGGLPPSSLRVDGGGFSGDSYLGGPGASYGGKGSGREVGLGTSFGPFGGMVQSMVEQIVVVGVKSPNSLGAGSGAGYGDSHFGGPGLSYGGTGSGGGVELGTGVGGAGPSYGGIGSGVAGLGTRFAEPGGRHGETSSDGGVGLGSGFCGLGPLGQMSRCGLSPGSMKTSSGGAHYSLSSGSAGQTQQQKKKYKVAHYNL